jgi:uncharacterized protein YbjT (DUF2867 family)
MDDGAGRVLLTGATGFVGEHVYPALVAAGFTVRCATRDPRAALARHPDREWVRADIEDREQLGAALAGCRAALYLVHAMAGGQGYEERERNAAHLFAEVAARCGLERIVYLGGVAPRGRPSRHLATRLATGEALRAGKVPTFELRASMIIGHGSLSWKIVRDLAVRLPAMVLPRWLATRSEPVAIDDVVAALTEALVLPLERAGIYDLPGPETMSAKEILLRIARLRGHRPITFSVPILSPRLSSYWLKLITGADYYVARQLVEGLSTDLVSSSPEFWVFLPQHQRLSFDDAARRALAQER